MNKEEIENRIIICEQKVRDYLEVGNTKTAERYNNEIHKWEKILSDLELLDKRKIKELLDYKKGYFCLEQENKKYKEVIDKAIDKLQLLIDIGFDYDGFNQADSLKTLIDELVGYAKESRKILKEVEETDINVGEVE